MERSAMTTEQRGHRLQQMRISTNSSIIGTEIRERSYIPSKELRFTGISSKTYWAPLPTLKWGLGRGGSWLHHVCSVRYIACTWAPLGWPCLPTRCSITVWSHDLAFLLHVVTKSVIWLCIAYVGCISPSILLSNLVKVCLDHSFSFAVSQERELQDYLDGKCSHYAFNKELSDLFHISGAYEQLI